MINGGGKASNTAIHLEPSRRQNTTAQHNSATSNASKRATSKSRQLAMEILQVVAKNKQIAAMKSSEPLEMRFTTPLHSVATVRYPLITPIGRMRATLCDNPALCTTSTTSSTFL